MQNYREETEIFHVLVHFPDGLSGHNSWSELVWKPGVRNFFWVSHKDAESKDISQPSLLYHQQGAGSAVEELGYEPAPIWDAGTTVED